MSIIRKRERNTGLFRSKKAMFPVLLAMILTLFVGLLIAIVFYQFHYKVKDSESDEKCRLSIFANHQISRARKESKGMLDFPVAFECPRKFVKIEMEQVEKYNRIDDNLVKNIIGEEVKSCWARTGAGELDPFQASTTVDQSFCMVCSDIVFDTDVREKAREEGYTFKGFQYWMATNKPAGLKTTLYEYLTGNRPDTETLRQLRETQNDDRYTINMDEKYVVVWRVQKYEQGWWNRLGEAILVGGVIALATGGVGLLAAGGAVVGYAMNGQSAGFQSGVFLAPEERLSSMMMSQEELLRRIRMNQPPKDSELYFCTQMIN